MCHFLLLSRGNVWPQVDEPISPVAQEAMKEEAD